MPFLRVIRDKRGYETTYLMHWYREGVRQRSRILYVFRTPGGVRVGRSALDRAVQQEIEARHPDIAFDWRSVVENQQVVEAAAEPRRVRKRRREDEEAPVGEAVVESRVESPPPAAPPRPAVPSAIEGSTPEEQMQFLARWYGLIRERIFTRTSEPERQEALLALAERLNPQAWTDADAIPARLQQAAEALERLSRVFVRRRRRSRRTSTARDGVESAAAGGSDTVAADPGAAPDDTGDAGECSEPDH